MKNLLLILTLLLSSQVMALTLIEENEVHLQSLKDQLVYTTDQESIDYLNKEIKTWTKKIREQKIKKIANDAIKKAHKIEQINNQITSINAETLNSNCLTYMHQYMADNKLEMLGQFTYVENKENQSCYSQYVYIVNEIESVMPMSHDELITYYDKVKADRLKKLEEEKSKL